MQTIILFYKYTDIPYPKRILKWQKKIGQELGLVGRVLIAHEGINATLSGEPAAIDRYVEIMRENPQFADVDFKYGKAEGECFPKLQVTVKPEIVRLCVDHNNAPLEETGVHLTPQQTHALLSNKPDDLIILDTRNDFESAIGAFTGAVKAPIAHFRDLPAYLDENLDQFKDKPVLMYCTGGVRCERATAYLKKKKVAKEVYQIEGGIHRYAEQYPDGFFRGKNYVFDGRIAVKVNDDLLGSCYACNKPCNEYTNCLNAACNRHYICCPDCLVRYQDACSITCQQLIGEGKVRRRPVRVKAQAL